MSTSKVDAKDPRTRPAMQMDPDRQVRKLSIDVSTPQYNMRRTPDPDHLPLPSLIALDKRHDDWCSKITETGCYGAYNGNVAIAGELWNPGVVFLEDTKGEGEAYIQLLSALSVESSISVTNTPTP